MTALGQYRGTTSSKRCLYDTVTYFFYFVLYTLDVILLPRNHQKKYFLPFFEDEMVENETFRVMAHDKN